MYKKKTSKRKKLKNLHTIFSFSIPFAVPVPDGVYLVRLDKRVAKVAVKRVQKKQVGRVEATGTFQM